MNLKVHIFYTLTLRIVETFCYDRLWAPAGRAESPFVSAAGGAGSRSTCPGPPCPRPDSGTPGRAGSGPWISAGTSDFLNQSRDVRPCAFCSPKIL